jgi:hypothetical protein
MAVLQKTVTTTVHAEDVVDFIASEVAQYVGHSFDQFGPSTWKISHRYTPAWAIVLAVILFPIGLLFLLVKDTESMTITCRRKAGKTVIEAQALGRRRFVQNMEGLVGQDFEVLLE